jgi:quinol monooxygenase YgiN
VTITLVVHLRAAAGQRDQLLPVVGAHAERSMRLEEGCLSFQVLVPEEEPDRVILLEVYRDGAALDAHRDSAHMAEYRTLTEQLVVERQIFHCRQAAGGP